MPSSRAAPATAPSARAKRLADEALLEMRQVVLEIEAIVRKRPAGVPGSRATAAGARR